MGTGSTRERTSDVHTTLPFPSNSQVALARSSLRVCTLERPHTTLVISLQERFYSGAFPPLALALYFLFHSLFAASRAPHIYRSRAHRRLLLLAARFRPFPSLTSTTTTTRAREPLACSLPRSLHIPLPSTKHSSAIPRSPRSRPSFHVSTSMLLLTAPLVLAPCPPLRCNISFFRPSVSSLRAPSVRSLFSPPIPSFPHAEKRAALVAARRTRGSQRERALTTASTRKVYAKKAENGGWGRERAGAEGGWKHGAAFQRGKKKMQRSGKNAAVNAKALPRRTRGRSRYTLPRPVVRGVRLLTVLDVPHKRPL